MKRELIITVLVVACLIAGIAYFRATHRATVGSEPQPGQPQDWRKTVERNPQDTDRRGAQSGSGMEVIPSLPDRFRRGDHRDSSAPDHSERPNGVPADRAVLGIDPSSSPLAGQNRIDDLRGDENDSGGNEAPYWEENVESAPENPDFYQPPESEDPDEQDSADDEGN